MKTDSAPRYLHLHKTGELKKRGDLLWSMMQDCELCPRLCKARRMDGETGICGAGDWLKIASFNAHYGEEKGLVGTGGSGTIFFSNCSLKCLFCQNYDISHLGFGKAISIRDLADIMLHLQNSGCHNINIVTPTHYVAHLVMAIELAAEKGLNLPLVYNTSSWDRIEVLKVLSGIVDIYLADLKFIDIDKAGSYLCDAPEYPEFALPAIKEMYEQVGNIEKSMNGTVNSGLMIRHLVMPGNAAGTEKAMKWIAHNLSKKTYVNIMAQYRPAYNAINYPEINRAVTDKEYRFAVCAAKNEGLSNLDIQGYI